MAQDTSQEKNPFEVLGLQGSEDLTAIRKAFLRIATLSHPDRLRTKPEAEKARALETFLAAKKAFETLSQPDKRREWSEKLARTRPAPTPAPVAPAVPRTPSAPMPLPPEPRSSAQVPPRGVPAPLPPEPRSGANAPPRGTPSPAAVALQIYKLGMLALEAEDYAQALELFSKAAKLHPTPRHQALELVSRGHQYRITRFLDRARESFERALQMEPDCREARAALELLDKQSGRFKSR